MRLFYERALARLIPAGAFRGLVATIEGRDVGFVFGGVFGSTYRGLQVSFDADHRALGLGNVLQARLIERLAGEGITTYDLGSDIEYKARWAEPGLTTATLVVLQR
jgi:CelD/BcsL family acetyltransferase involved in cellulose biosynthesis